MRTSAREIDTSLSCILMSIEPACKAHVMTMLDRNEVWKTLKRTYHVVTEASIHAKFTKLRHLRMVRRETVIKFVNRIGATVNEQIGSGLVVSSTVLKFLISSYWNALYKDQSHQVH